MNKEYYFELSLILLATILIYSLVYYSGNLVFAAEPEKYLFDVKIGSIGADDGEFNIPHTIAFDLSGNMYVTDTKNARVQKFDSNGTFLTKWGERGTSDGQFMELEDIEVDSFDRVYVTDRNTASITKFTKGGVTLTCYYCQMSMQKF